MTEIYERSKEYTHGPITAVKCPWCKNKNNHQDLGPTGRETFKKTGMVIECDHCGSSYTIQKVQMIISVQQFHGEIPPEDEQ